jgi:hypothetical protein
MTINQKTADRVGVDEGESLLVQGDLSKSENLLGGDGKTISEKENDVLNDVGKIMNETEPAHSREPTPDDAVEEQRLSSRMEASDDVIAPEKDGIAPEVERGDFVLFVDNDFYEADSSFEESFCESPELSLSDQMDRQSEMPAAPATGVRNEDSVLFSMVGQDMLRSNFSTSPYSIDESVADALSDIHSISRAASLSEAPDSSLDDLPVAPDPLLSSVAPLRKERRLGMLALIIVPTSLVLAAVIIGYAKYSFDDKVQESLTEQRVRDLQHRYDELIALLITAKPDSVANLRKQLEETQQKLALLRSEQKSIAVQGDNTDEGGEGASPPRARGKRSPGRNAASNKKKPKEAAASLLGDLEGTAAPSAASATPDAPSKQANALDDLLGKPPAPASETLTAPLDSLLSDGTKEKTKHRLSRADVQQGMRRVANQVKQCSNGDGGSMVMAVTILKTGAVSKAVATGAFAGSEMGKCAAKVIRGLRFPPTRNDVSVKYTFTL